MAEQSSDADKKEQARSTQEIQADMEETRQRLADNIAQLKAETAPKVLAAKAKAKASAVFTDPQSGSLRTERVAAVVAVVVGLVVLRRGLKARSHRRELERLGELVWVPVPKQSVRPELRPVARVASEVAPLPATTEPLAITAG